MIDVSKAIQELRADTPEDKRTVALMRKLAVELDRKALAAKLKIAAKHSVNTGAITALPGLVTGNPLGLMRFLAAEGYTDTTTKILEDLTEARLRSRQYLAVLEGLPDDSLDLPAEVLPLFYNVLGTQQQAAGLEGAPFQSPDYLAPIYALNQYEAFAEDVRSFWSDMLKYVGQSIRELASVGRDYGPLVFGAAAILGAAIYFGGRR